MRWRNRQRSRNVQDRRGKGKMAAGGGLGFLGLALVVYLLGGDPSYFLQEGVSRTTQSVMQGDKIPEETQDEMVNFISVVLAETETTWTRAFQQKGARYQEPVLVFFNGAVTSACGRAQAAMGPFYCPLDEKIYIDLGFFYDLEKRHDAPGDFAQAYVVAHEVGHHVQNQLGILQQAERLKSRANRRDRNQISVQTELMADCLAGVWAYSAGQEGLLEDGDIEEALNTATQIGDDRLQKQSQGYVVPDSFTHGSGAQRYAAFQEGYRSGALNACIE